MERDLMKPEGKAFFVSEQLKAMHRSTVNLALKKYGELAGLSVAVHPHTLRHACGYALADQGADTRFDSGLSRAPKYSAYGTLYR
jgi:type 1 fimbriae regulatory protein FimB